IGNRCYMRLVDGHCAALIVDPSDRSFRCSVYERRPDVCRWLERGSGQCRADRHEKGERPLLALARLTQR
ncbi:MAG TPA: zinc/iron-chelating domain-containing protein, partial [Polyangiaceae bacterium]|nr:zinc/iron-chelating domain-containing protein [Polyangiaceae bacterium]